MMAKYKAQFYMCGLNHFTAISNEERGNRDLSSMICVMPAGGGVSNQAVARMRTVFPSLMFAYIFYGSSEVSGVSGTMDEFTLGSLLPGVEVYIRDRESGKRLGPGEHGEIMARTPTMMQGYLNRSFLSLFHNPNIFFLDPHIFLCLDHKSQLSSLTTRVLHTWGTLGIITNRACSILSPVQRTC